ncbi:hypothetical protein VI01_23720 [Pantoea sp. SM3]|nr:hypothetical protein VI01_23720 [Pantoea sp. SM3]
MSFSSYRPGPAELQRAVSGQSLLLFLLRHKGIVRMTPGEQQQEFILSLAQGGGIFHRLLRLPDAQAEFKPLSGGLLRQAGGKPEFTDVRTHRDGPV